MHSIRSAARRQAWYHNDDPDSRTYNFFGRSNPRRVPDVENFDDNQTLDHTVTENDATSPAEAKRREEFGGEQGRGGVRKAGTFPGMQAGDGPFTRDMPDDADAHNEKSKDSGLSGATPVPSSGPAGFTDVSAGDEGARKRKSRKFHIPFLGRKEDDDDDDAAAAASRANTTDDSESRKKKKNRPKLPIMGQLKAIFASWINILLIAVPVGIALDYAGANKVAVFVVNFVAIIPLASMLSYATEELALYVGETIGGLLNASFGNATELIVSVIALTQGNVLIVQTSLIGSMLSNLLLVLGMCFFFGGFNRVEQYFNITVAQTAASLLALAIGSLVMPTAFRIFSPNDAGVTPTSRATALLLLFVYACYLIFQLRTHIDMYNEPSKKSPTKARGKKSAGEALKGIATIGAGTAAASGGKVNEENLVNDDEQEATPQLTVLVALITLAASTALIALTSDGMVSAIDVIGETISEEFIGLILIPIVGNAAEHATAVTVAIKDKMDLAIGVAVGSSLQIALLVLPFMVFLGWCGVGSSYPAVMDLNFDGFLVVVLFIAVILVNYLIQDGKSHWLEGIMLMTAYVIIATAAYYYPAVSPPS